jgi:hypothetical protein
MSPESAVLYDGGADALGDPIHDGDRLLLPEFNDDQLIAFTAIG